MITTIQLDESVKRALDRLKENKETYEQVIVNLIRLVEEQRKKQEELLIEGCKVMYQDMLDINKEWEAVDAEIDWEW
jgi:predicted CopG family antitoxin